MCSPIATSSRLPPSIASRRQITTKSWWVAKNSMPAATSAATRSKPTGAAETAADVIAAQSSIACSITAA